MSFPILRYPKSKTISNLISRYRYNIDILPSPSFKLNKKNICKTVDHTIRCLCPSSVLPFPSCLSGGCSWRGVREGGAWRRAGQRRGSAVWRVSQFWTSFWTPGRRRRRAASHQWGRRFGDVFSTTKGWISSGLWLEVPWLAQKKWVQTILMAWIAPFAASVYSILTKNWTSFKVFRAYSHIAHLPWTVPERVPAPSLTCTHTAIKHSGLEHAYVITLHYTIPLHL